MRAFEDYTIEWEGEVYSIPSNRLLPVIAAVEELFTLNELLQVSMQNKVPLARLASAYGIILRSAGADVSDADVYQGMFQGNDLQARMLDAVNGLLGLMIPPEQQGAGEQPGKSRKAGKRSSKNSTRQRSARAGSRR